MRLQQVGTVIASTGLLASLLTGCSDPCAKLKVTDRDRTVLQNGGEVEREAGGVECELQDESTGWERDS